MYRLQPRSAIIGTSTDGHRSDVLPAPVHSGTHMGPNELASENGHQIRPATATSSQQLGTARGLLSAISTLPSAEGSILGCLLGSY